MKRRDTVEEFWTEESLDNCVELSHEIDVEDFLIRLAGKLETDKELWPAPSGRWALKWLLDHTVTDKDGKILIGALNCSVVADAVRAAGFRVDTFDLASTSGAIDWHHVESRLDASHQAVIIPHLYGVPTDFRPLLEVCRQRGIVIIEDCAHTLGGRIGSQFAGTVGDASFFSFNYDKPVSLGWGGAILINDDIMARRLSPPRFPTPEWKWERSKLREFLATMRARRQLIGHEDIFTRIWLRIRPAAGFSMPEQSIGRLRAALGIWQLNNYRDVLAIRNRNAESVSKQAKAYSCWHIETNVTPAWLKQKVILVNPKVGLMKARELRRKGLRVGNFNWSTVVRADQDKGNTHNAETVANFGLDVPIHQNMTYDEIQFMCRVLNGED